ncbi:hypothetical protein J4732_16035 [Serratia marcescens]|uniref:Uncharacterized protein n=1 Tax=Serratia marcescens TaxID=615 RepID=A0A939NT77_SERMA|nr:hypothetical protein [Serratia marcescens]
MITPTELAVVVGKPTLPRAVGKNHDRFMVIFLLCFGLMQLQVLAGFSPPAAVISL